GKGRRERLAPVGSYATRALGRWLRVRELHPRVPEGPDAPVFVNRFGRRISVRSIGRMLEKYLKLTGLDNRTTPHSLRHFYGVFMLNFIPVEGGYGLRLPEVQKLMGHEDSSSTAHYAREDPIILESKLRMIDHFAMGQTDKERDIRAWIAKRHTDIAQRMLSNMPHGDSI
ncbi:hypothetical protein LCGC14_2381190, partial [marine sediment metagenome]